VVGVLMKTERTADSITLHQRLSAASTDQISDMREMTMTLPGDAGDQTRFSSLPRNVALKDPFSVAEYGVGEYPVVLRDIPPPFMRIKYNATVVRGYDHAVVVYLDMRPAEE